MSTTKKKVELIGKDADGNEMGFMPVTKLSCIEDGGAAEKAALSDSDAVPVLDSEASNTMKKVTIANLKDACKSTAEHVEATMSASKWSGGQYSFESAYPFASYNIEIEPSGNMTAEQYAVWSAAQIVGSSTTNICKSLGTVPEIDLPIIITVETK